MLSPSGLLRIVVVAAVAGLAQAGVPPRLQAPVEAIRAVGPEGQGNEAAAAAVKQLSAAPIQVLPGLLEAMDGANDYALNWLRSAAETVEQRGRAAGKQPPVLELEEFLKDTRHHPRARRLAFEILRRSDAKRAAALVPGFANDPANELRRDAVQVMADAAAAKAGADKPAAVTDYRKALEHAREADQIDAIAKKLGELGEKVDLQKVFGWVTRWRLVGPFDNTGGAGFAQAFPPESGVDLAAEFDGKAGKVRWVDFESKDDYGLIDFNKPFTDLKEVTGYAFSEFWSDSARPVELRLGCKNGWKVWVNGRFVFGRDEYHRNMEIDQYRLPVELKAGRNTILVKCCQNEQKEDWTKEWEFQLRVTDAQGTPVVSAPKP